MSYIKWNMQIIIFLRKKYIIFNVQDYYNIFLLSQNLKTVESKWTIISLLCLLVISQIWTTKNQKNC